MSFWVHLNADSTVFYPTCDISSPDDSRTEVAGESGLVTAVQTYIRSVQVGPAHTLGTLTIADHGGTTVRTIATPNASTSNMSVNAALLGFTIKGGFQASCNTNTTCDLYIQFDFVSPR